MNASEIRALFHDQQRGQPAAPSAGAVAVGRTPAVLNLDDLPEQIRRPPSVGAVEVMAAILPKMGDAIATGAPLSRSAVMALQPVAEMMVGHQTTAADRVTLFVAWTAGITAHAAAAVAAQNQAYEAELDALRAQLAATTTKKAK